MGCDGGTIPKRDELVKVKKKPEAKDKQGELSFQWKCCAITQETLQSPIVTCGYGRLYNKSTVIEGLLNRQPLPECAKHIKSLKDIKDLQLMPNPEYDSSAEKTEGSIDNRAAPFICPITGLEMTGKFRFVCLWKCGCVMSERALKALNISSCPKCQTNFATEEIIVLNGNEADLEIMKSNMGMRQANQKAAKKSKKNSSVSSDVPNGRQNTNVNAAGPSSSSEATITSTSSTSRQVNQIPAKKSRTSPVDAADVPHKKQKTNVNTAGGPSSSSETTITSTTTTSNTTRKEDCTSFIDPTVNKVKAEYSVAKDPQVTDVYKSLFTSHQSEKQQTRAHWVTYNPFYN